jgi:uncharacterized protein YodC (DUF2158 family)
VPREFDMEFKVGDVVQLRSGGPRMTVQSINASTKDVECTWFDGSERFKDMFQPEMLKIVGEEDALLPIGIMA